MLEQFYHIHDGDKIWWTTDTELIGRHYISFDKKTVYNLFRDFPWKLSVDEVDLFVKENPYWANKFKPQIEKYYKEHESADI